MGAEEASLPKNPFPKTLSMIFIFKRYLYPVIIRPPTSPKPYRPESKNLMEAAAPKHER
jgi:hypothetical protein